METEIRSFRFYHFIKAEYVEDFLRTGRLKVTQLGHSNDCFEFRPAFSSLEVEKEWEDSICDAEPCAICLSARMSSPVMWGHYGDKGKGVCLVFDIPVEKWRNPKFSYLFQIYGIQLPLGKVQYSNEQYTIDKVPPITSVAMNDLVTNLACTKAIDWKYEQEYRVIIPECMLQADKGCLFYSGLKQYCTAVLLGWECPYTRLYMERVKTIYGMDRVWILSTYPSRERFEICVNNLNGQDYSDTDGSLLETWVNG